MTRRDLFFIILCLCAGFFIFKNTEAKEPALVINEILIGSEISSKKEFIELYNPTDNDINLGNYSLKKKTKSGTESNLLSSAKFIGIIKAKQFFVISHPDYLNELGADLSYSGASYSIANDNTIILYGPKNNIVDLVGLGETSEYEQKAIPNPEIGKSVERKKLGEDSDNNFGDFIIKQNPSPGEYELEQDEPEVTDEESSASDTIETIDSHQEAEEQIPIDKTVTTYKHYNLGTILINELVSDPSDEDEEWVELVNTSNEEIDLSSWKVSEGSGSITLLSGTIEPYSYFLLNKIKGRLNNAGDKIELRDSQDVLIDTLSYGNWDDGNIDDNAPSANDPNSIARKINARNTYNNKNDFVVTLTPSKNKANIINLLPEESEISLAEKADFDYSDEIYISEILPNPFGNDESEFIELYNAGNKNINLSGYRLGDASTKRFELSGTIGAKQYLIVKRELSKIALNNGKDKVSLYSPLEDKASKEIVYEKAKEGFSYNCIYFEEEKLMSDCLWSESITPGERNKVERINHAPSADFDCPEIGEVGLPIRFDSSDTIDEDNDVLSFYWDFGDGFNNNLAHPEHTYLNAGEYTIKLSVSDAKNINEIEKKIIITGINENENLEYKIIISEFMPNPTGADEDGEWIEIHNGGEARVNIRNWQLDDNEGGSKPFNIEEDYWLDPGAYFLFDREETGLALNNTIDAVRLLDRSGTVVDTIEYKDVSENRVMARTDNNTWEWSLESTPGEANIIKIIDKGSKKSVNTKSTRKTKTLTDTVVEKARDFEKGDLIRTRGTVAVLPGIFGSQYFYIVGSPGIQVYNYKKDFPVLSIGDYIEVSGEISEIYGEKRIKTKDANDMKVLEHLEDPVARVSACESIDETSVGELINISGEVVEQKSSNIYLDDGSDERLIYIKTGAGINASSYKEGDKIAVTGIVSKTQSGVRIQPRNKDDIVRKDYEKKEGRVLGKVSEETEWSLPAQNQNQKLYQYLLIIFGTIVVLLIIIIFRLLKK